MRTGASARIGTLANLLLVNARVITIDPALPDAGAVAVVGERVLAVGGSKEVRHVTGRNARIIDCQGLTLLPGFIDAHCHLLALARAHQDLDCRPENAPSIAAIQELLRRLALALPAGSWLRGQGYDDLSLAERRHPTRWDLDRAAPEHPVRLDHRSGHASVLNTLGLRLANIRRDTPDPVSGVIERDPASGEPTGLLLEMADFLRDRLGNTRGQASLEAGVKMASKQLLGYGITSVQDAGADNGVHRWATMQRLQASDALPLRVTMFGGSPRMGELLEAGMACGSGGQRLRLGHIKIMLTLTTGVLSPSLEELGHLVRRAHQAGFPVAIHCVEQEAVAAAAEVLTHARGDGYRPPVRDRIEHCAECPPELAERVRRSGAAVVTQPGFIYWNGPQYRQRTPQHLRPHLYPAGALHRAGVPVAFGSDAPVIDPNPWPGIYSAVTGLAHDGHPLGVGEPQDREPPAQTVPVVAALRMYTLAAAEAEGSAADKGSITPGKLADLTLVDADPRAVAPDALRNIKPMLTVLAGKVAWEA